jgi:UDP-glucose 4-epimerase
MFLSSSSTEAFCFAQPAVTTKSTSSDGHGGVSNARGRFGNVSGRRHGVLAETYVTTKVDSAFHSRKVLITGGAGFIGSNLARRLVDLGAEVVLVDSLIPEYGGNLNNIADLESRVRLNISDVRDEQSMRYLLRGQEYLFNLAGQTSHMDSMRDPYVDLDINCKAQLAILEACRKYNADVKVVFASTRQVYGKPERLPVDERHLLRPVDVNGINKMAGEWYHLVYNNVYAIRASVLRLTNTIGPGMRVKDARQTFLGVWIRHVIENTPFEVWDGQQLRDFTYVDDAVDAFLLAAVDDNANGEIFNLGGDAVISLLDLARLLVDVNGGGSWVSRSFPPDRKLIDIGDYYSDFSHIRTILGWEPRVSLREGLQRTLAFYRQSLKHYL